MGGREGKKAYFGMNPTCQPRLPSAGLLRALPGHLASVDVARRAGRAVLRLGEGLCRWQRPVPPLNPPEMLEGPVAITGGSTWERW